MRIISGIFGSRKLNAPETNNIRPTSDRAKESLFNMIINRFDLEGMAVLDLFSGTGNLGLECISRGAATCCFVDQNVLPVLKNIDMLGVKDKSEVVKSDVLRFLKVSVERCFDLVFCDPPYNYESYTELLEYISRMKTVLILEHSGDFKLSPEFEEMVFLRRKVGAVNFTFFNFSEKESE
jgi:16S rRNA (guanine(966)-N(2))-methyltransferase RsmD